MMNDTGRRSLGSCSGVQEDDLLITEALLVGLGTALQYLAIENLEIQLN